MPVFALPLAAGLGLEWLPVASILVPLVLIVLLVWLGSRNAV